MKEIRRKCDSLILKEKRKYYLDQIITFFEQEMEQKIGMVAAEIILDFFLQNIGGDIYNKGVEDSKDVLKRRFGDLELDLELLLNK